MLQNYDSTVTKSDEIVLCNSTKDKHCDFLTSKLIYCDLLIKGH